MTDKQPENVTATKNDGARRRIRMDPDVRREQILQEATRLIAESGFNGITLEAVATACDIRKPSVLRYFPSMTELLQAVLARRDLLDFMEATYEDREWSTPTASRAFLTAFMERNLTQRELIRLFKVLGAEALDSNHPAHGYFVERTRNSHATIEGILSWTDDPVAATIELLAFIEGLELEWLRDPRVDLLQIWNRFSDRFFAAPACGSDEAKLPSGS